MRVLLVSGSRARLPDPVYPLGAAMVGTALRRAGHELRWFDALRHAEPAAALAAEIASCRPEAVLLSIRNVDNAAFPGTSRHFEDHLELARAIRRGTRAPFVLGGSAFSLMPEAFLAYLGADAGVAGEGEAAAVELVGRISRGEPLPRVSSPPRLAPPFVVPDRDLFDAPWYYQNGGLANVQTKRGCALECVYCTYPLLEGSCIRAVEPGAVVDELAAIRASGIGHVFVVDAVFNRPEAHAAAICEEILRRGLEISFTGYFVPRGDLPELPALLKRAGCAAVELGTDSLSDPVLARLAKGFTADEAIAYSRRLADAGIQQCHNLIFGCPGETAATIAESTARMDALRPTAVIAMIGLRVFPGTPLWRLGGGEASPPPADPTALLEPTFFLEEAVADTVVETVAGLVEARPNWIAPGLGKRYNLRYLERLRRRHKGLLWTIYGGGGEGSPAV
jgi:radical SAM superfamily enzyme YgiQ (UPF0313 family)